MKENKLNLRKLYEQYETNNDGFLSMYQQETLEGLSFDEIKDKVSEIFTEADKYAETNNLEYKYFQLAKKPLWNELVVESSPFIYQGFEARVMIDMDKNLDELTPVVTIQNNNVGALEADQFIVINEEFISGLKTYQSEIFEKALQEVNERVIIQFKEVWIVEQQRLDKWIKTCKITLKD